MLHLLAYNVSTAIVAGDSDDGDDN